MQNKNPICWWELATHDADKSVEFLQKAFDWNLVYDEQQNLYETKPEDYAGSGGLSGGGVFTLRKAKLPFLTMYIKVDDIDAKAKLIEELGGHIVEAPFDLPSGTRICLFNEPSGITLAMLQTASK